MRVSALVVAFLTIMHASCTIQVAPTATPPTSPPAPRAGTPSPTPTPTPTASPTPSAAPTSYLSPRGTITVDQPRAFARVTSPLSVSGTASVFEAAFTWRVVDLSGRELAKGNGQASQGAPARGAYSFTATFTVSSDTFGYLEVTSQSPRDGSVDDQARVPLMLAAR